MTPLKEHPTIQTTGRRLLRRHSTRQMSTRSTNWWDSVLVENMHDIPYVQDRRLGPEIVSCMTRLAHGVRQVVPEIMPCGVQVLACGNKQALAVAKACGLQFIRAEGFVFGHIADEGYTDACAGDLLRYRRQIDASEVLIFTDLKKKHSSHAVTQDVGLLDTAKAAEFFLTDGVIITGTSTGEAVNSQDLACLAGKVRVPILIGSGVTQDNLSDYFHQTHAVIIGSHLKVSGHWANELCEERIMRFMDKVKELRHWES